MSRPKCHLICCIVTSPCRNLPLWLKKRSKKKADSFWNGYSLPLERSLTPWQFRNAGNMELWWSFRLMWADARSCWMMFWTSRSKLWTKCFSQCIPSLAARLMRVVVPPSRFGSWDRTARGFWSHYVVQVISSQLGITSPTAHRLRFGMALNHCLRVAVHCSCVFWLQVSQTLLEWLMEGLRFDRCKGNLKTSRRLEDNSIHLHLVIQLIQMLISVSFCWMALLKGMSDLVSS